MKKKIQNIHDKTFKKSISVEENAKDFLNLVLPERIKKVVDLSKISFDDTGYVSEQLVEYVSDLIIKTTTKDGRQQLDIYFLIEHKSAPDNQVLFQLLRYIYMSWEQDLTKKEPFRIIVPVVFYHGEKQWKIPLEFQGQMEVPAPLKEYLPNFRYILFDTNNWDIQQESIGTLKHNVLLYTSLLLLKNSHNPDIKSIETVFSLWQKHGLFEDASVIMYLLYYITETKETDVEDIKRIITSYSHKNENIMETLAQKLRQEGRQEGMQKGIQQSKKEDIVNVFVKLHMPIEQITSLLNVSKETVIQALREKKLIDG